MSQQACRSLAVPNLAIYQQVSNCVILHVCVHVLFHEHHTCVYMCMCVHVHLLCEVYIRVFIGTLATGHYVQDANTYASWGVECEIMYMYE